MANHLVLFAHGHDGHPEELTYISTQLQHTYPQCVIAHLLRSYEGKTHDGIDNAGQLVAHEIQECISTLLEKDITIKYLSFVGHSLGGLVLRYAIGLLHAKNFFGKVKPMNFTTFATPHLGIRKPMTSSSLEMIYNSTFNFLVPAIAGGRSTTQLLLSDDYDGRPLLVAMAEKDSEYFQALHLFPHKSLYANTALDFLVPYYTAAVSVDNFAGMHPHIPGYEPVIFDINTCVASEGKSDSRGQLQLLGCQIPIVESLNTLGWAKYPVHIHNSLNPHTAILVFKVWNKETCEGKVVVRHYQDNFVVADDSIPV